MRTAIFSSLFRGAGNVLVALLGDDAAAAQPVRAMLEQLATQIGRQANPAELAAGGAGRRLRCPTAIRRLTAVVRGLVGRAVESAGRTTARRRCRAGGRGAGAIARRGRKAARSTRRSPSPAGSMRCGRWAWALSPPRAKRSSRCSTIGIPGNPTGGAGNAGQVRRSGRWRDSDRGLAAIESAIAPAAGDVLFSRPQWLTTVLDAIDGGKLALADFDPARLKLLESQHASPRFASRVEKLIATPGSQSTARSAGRLSIGADADRPAGPRPDLLSKDLCELSSLGRSGKRSRSEPGGDQESRRRGDSAEPAGSQSRSQSAICQLRRRAGRRPDLSGMIASETATSITLRRAENATDTLQRSEIEELRSTRQSLMPEGLEKQLDPQAVADVIAYLLAAP